MHQQQLEEDEGTSIGAASANTNPSFASPGVYQKMSNNSAVNSIAATAGDSEKDENYYEDDEYEDGAKAGLSTLIEFTSAY